MSVPFLPCVLEFAVTEYATVPAPFPVPPAVTAIHAPLDVTVQLHPADTDTVTAPVPPLASNVWLSGERVAAQEGVGSVGDCSTRRDDCGKTSYEDKTGESSDPHATPLRCQSH